MRFGDGSASGDSEIQSLATWAYSERVLDRQTTHPALGRLIVAGVKLAVPPTSPRLETGGQMASREVK